MTLRSRVLAAARAIRSSVVDGLAASRAISLYALGGLAASVVGFLALPVFTRLFTPDEYGVIGLFTAGVGLLTPVLATTGYVYVLVDPEGGRRSSSVASATALIATALGALLTTGVLVVWWSGAIANYPIGLLLLALLAAWANVWVALRLHFFQAHRQPGRFFGLSAAPPIASVALTLVLAVSIEG